MRAARAILAEIVGLFVDDGSLALGLVLWCGMVGIGASILPDLVTIGAPILFIGCAAILLASIARPSTQTMENEEIPS
jgi:hypothetical protein